MTEYIEREALLDRLETLIKRITPIEESRDMFFHDSGVNGAVMGARLEVQRIPAADVAPVAHGRWVYRPLTLHSGIIERWICSVCGCEKVRTSDYCPNCGARMDGE